MKDETTSIYKLSGVDPVKDISTHDSAESAAKVETFAHKLPGDIPTKEKTVLNETLARNIAAARLQGKTIGLVQGSYDLFHLGHLRYLLKAKSLCDFLIVALDSDEKIRKRKGSGRPIIPEGERYDFISLLGFVDGIIIKQVNDPKWGTIKAICPDVLVVVKENYSDDDWDRLRTYCGKLAVLPRQSKSSTSDKIRKITISAQRNRIENLDEKIAKTVEEMRARLKIPKEPTGMLARIFDVINESTDWVCPVAAVCRYNGRYYSGTNKSDFNLPMYDIVNRTELYYAATEHAEVNLLKKMGEVENLDSPLYISLFPCDKCMKILIQNGVKKIYYLEDHEERHWSQRSHALADANGIKTIRINPADYDADKKLDNK